MGDTLWDIASASFNKNSGHKASTGEILGEVNRLAKKNNVVDMNNIPIGTAIDTSPEEQKVAYRRLSTALQTTTT